MLKIKEELFVDIKGYDGRYKIGNKGTVIGVSRSNDNRYKDKQWILKQYEDKNGYMYVTLQKDENRKTIKVHRLVAENFLENPDNLPQINHIDGNKKNNNVNNLEFCTAKHNMSEAVRIGLFDKCKDTQRKNAIKNNLGKYHILGNEATKKKIGQYDKNNNLIKIYESISEASRQTGITVASISYSANGIRKSGGGYLWHFV